MNTKIFTFGQKIYEWLSKFAPTYRGVLPSGVKPNDLYLRFDGYFDNFATTFILPVFIYKTNATSYSSILLLADEIESAIGDGGIVIGDYDMRIKIEKGSPFYQDRSDEDESVKSGYINLELTIYAVSAEKDEKEYYTVSFYADGELVDTRTFTRENQSVIPPPVPNKDGYVGYWEDFTVSVYIGDIDVKAIYVPRNTSLYSGEFYASNVRKLRKGSTK